MQISKYQGTMTDKTDLLKNDSKTFSVGKSINRSDAPAKAMGRFEYIDDLSFPGMLYAKILRSRHPHARITGIDTSRAESMPGVKAVLTAREIPVNSFGPSLQDQPLLADEKVRHMGDGVAAVAAVSSESAEEALDKIRIEYDPLPAVFDPIEAMSDNAPRVHGSDSNIYMRHRIRKGDAEEAISNASLVVEEHFSTQMVEHVSLEPHSSVVFWDAWNRLTVWGSIGRISLARTDMARVLSLPVNRIRVVATNVGGNFGGKNEITMEPVLALLAKKTGAPVKCTYTREEEFFASTTRHPFVMDYTTGVSKTGKILGRKIKIVADGGAYCSWSETTLGKASILSSGPYKIDNISVDGYAVYTNKTVGGAMRGFGAPQICFAYESHMDTIANKLGMDPLEIRLINAYDESSASPTGQMLHSVAIKKSLNAAADRFGWKEVNK